MCSNYKFTQEILKTILETSKETVDIIAESNTNVNSSETSITRCWLSIVVFAIDYNF